MYIAAVVVETIHTPSVQCAVFGNGDVGAIVAGNVVITHIDAAVSLEYRALVDVKPYAVDVVEYVAAYKVDIYATCGAAFDVDTIGVPVCQLAIAVSLLRTVGGYVVERKGVAACIVVDGTRRDVVKIEVVAVDIVQFMADRKSTRLN